MAKEHIAYTYKLCPTEEQKILFEKIFGCCRKVYNLMLKDNKEYYKKSEPPPLVLRVYASHGSGGGSHEKF